MNGLLEKLLTLPELRELAAEVHKTRCCAAVTGLSPVHRAMVAAALAAETKRPLLLLCADEKECARQAADVQVLLGVEPVRLPERELQLRPASYSRQWENARLSALYRMARGDAPVVVTTAAALVQRCLSREVLLAAAFSLEVGARYDVQDLCRRLTAAGYTQDDIKGFDDLKKVADDIQARKAELGVDGAFTSAGMDGSSDWRFKTHLANLPIYYEYKADGIGSTDAIKGTYLDNYKQIWDLYITDSTCDPTLLASKTGNDAVAEFVGKKAVFYQNGTWAYNDVKDLGDDNLGMLPIYIGVDGEENQGLCTGSENFWCVNNNSSDADIQATLDFLYWCVTSEAGTSAMADKMGFVIPFKKAKDSTNPLITIANQYVADGKTSVDWCFSTMPSEEWKNGVGSALTAYAAGTGKWDDVVTAFVDGWAKEYKLANG